MDEKLELLRRQYFQLLPLDQITFQSDEQLKGAQFQAQLYHGLFAPDLDESAPPVGYKVRVLREVVRRIESSISDPDEDVRLSATYWSSSSAFLLSSLIRAVLGDIRQSRLLFDQCPQFKPAFRNICCSAEMPCPLHATAFSFRCGSAEAYPVGVPQHHLRLGDYRLSNVGCRVASGYFSSISSRPEPRPGKVCA